MTTNITHIGEDGDSKPNKMVGRPTSRAAGKVAVVATGVLAALGAAMATVTNVAGKDGEATKQNMAPPNSPNNPNSLNSPNSPASPPAPVDSQTQGVAAVGTVTEGAEVQRVERFRYTSLNGTHVMEIAIWEENGSAMASVTDGDEVRRFVIPRNLDMRFGGGVLERAKMVTIICTNPNSYVLDEDALEDDLRRRENSLRRGSTVLIKIEGNDSSMATSSERK